MTDLTNVLFKLRQNKKKSKRIENDFNRKKSDRSSTLVNNMIELDHFTYVANFPQALVTDRVLEARTNALILAVRHSPLSLDLVNIQGQHLKL